jgi:two-component system response regulator CpxR
MQAKPLLLIDDDAELTALVTEFLAREGFAVESEVTGRAGLERAAAGEHAVVLLDIMLPDLDGFEVLKGLRRVADVPVIMLTARGDEVDRIVGLELGADDYLPKPFNPRELVARIKAILRRAPHLAGGVNGAAGTGDGAPGDPSRQSLRFGELEIDLERYRATLERRELELTTVEFALLRELALAAGRVLSRDALLDRIQGREPDVFDRSIDVHVSHLRRKLNDDPREPRYIRTVRSVGYQFVAEPR